MSNYPLKEGNWKFRWGVSKAKILKGKYMYVEQKLEFQEGFGGGGDSNKKPSVGRVSMDIFFGTMY